MIFPSIIQFKGKYQQQGSTFFSFRQKFHLSLQQHHFWILLERCSKAFQSILSPIYIITNERTD